MAVPLGAAISQSRTPRAPRALSVRVDNDAFDFWMLPWNRPDEEYTSGVHIAYETRERRFEIGQDIYTPALAVGTAHAPVGSRPSAGWLYVSRAARWLSEAASHDLSLAVGVTGPPSLARFTQNLAHHAAPSFNRPTDWSRQIAFEPGMIARYEQRRRLVVSDARMLGLDVLPRVTLSAGNVLTAGELGLDTRAGWHLSHPWLGASEPFEVTLASGVALRGVARDLFLDGNTFTRGPRVGHERWVESGNIGLDLRWRAFSAGYRVVAESRSYAAGPRWHPWASLIGAVTFDR